MRKDIEQLILTLCVVMGFCRTFAAEEPAKYYPNCEGSNRVENTGSWAFVNSRGIMTTGTFTYGTCADGSHTWKTEPPHDFTNTSQNSGVLIQWLDQNKTRLFRIEQFVDGKEDGYFAHFIFDGRCEAVGMVDRVKGRRLQTLLDANGKLEAVFPPASGNKEVTAMWYPSGAIRERSVYSTTNRSGCTTEFWENGNIKKETTNSSSPSNTVWEYKTFKQDGTPETERTESFKRERTECSNQVQQGIR